MPVPQVTCSEGGRNAGGRTFAPLLIIHPSCDATRGRAGLTCWCLADVLRLMHDGTGLQKLHRRRVGPPREKTGRRVLAEAHLADSVARGSGLLWETSLDAELDVVRVTGLITCLCAIASVHVYFSSSPGFRFHWMLALRFDNLMHE